MDKKTPYSAYYYSVMQNVTLEQLKAINPLPSIDISAIQQEMDKNEIYGIIQGENGYHERFWTMKQAPYLLYVQGDLSVLNKRAIAIVGPRKMSLYAEQVLEYLFASLCQYDLVTVSGMASGVDTCCHELSLRYNLPTIAVLGGGFGHFLRSGRRDLMKKIVERGGAIISEYKHSFAPTKRSFPLRNRIIAGIADVIFLPEAQTKSGSLITADFAYKDKKLVVAPMQSIFAETSSGTNTYIADGRITPIADIYTFIEKYFSSVQKKSSHMQTIYETHIDLTIEEKNIVILFTTHTEITIEIIVDETPCGFESALVHISMLEMKGVIKEKSPGVYIKNNLY